VIGETLVSCRSYIDENSIGVALAVNEIVIGAAARGIRSHNCKPPLLATTISPLQEALVQVKLYSKLDREWNENMFPTMASLHKP
jgi:hypothetical protein